MSDDHCLKLGNDAQAARVLPGVRVVIPDGRKGTLDKWPAITDNGLVKVNLDGGGCYVSQLRNLVVDQDFRFSAEVSERPQQQRQRGSSDD